MSLRVSADGRRLQTADGAAFFWLGDTAWELPQRLTLEETDFYCRTRGQQGFNVIQITAISEFSSRTPNTGNAAGEYALHDWNPAHPNEAYFAHLDAQLEIAARYGLHVGLVITWGDKVGPQIHGDGPEIFTPDNAHGFGQWIGARYAKATHLIWVIGGDRTPTSAQQLETWRSLALGVRSSGATQLMTFHPQGETSSSFWVHAESWLDCNMIQSGHMSRDNPLNRSLIAVDTARLPRKPVLNAEPCYEDYPINWNFENGVFTALDVRRAAYWSVFCGACGVTYGHYCVFMFHDLTRPSVWPHSQMFEWTEALTRPGALQMRWLHGLMTTYPMALPTALPRLTSDVCALHEAGTLLIYAPDPRAIELPDIAVRRAWCFDPRNGAKHALKIGSSFTPIQGFEDWVLILETN